MLNIQFEAGNTISTQILLSLHSEAKTGFIRRSTAKETWKTSPEIR